MTNLINKDTILFEKDIEDTFDFQCKNAHKYYQSLSKLISRETGTPEFLIYGPSIFYIKNWFKIDENWYYFKKQTNEVNLINELIGELISEYFGLDTIHYKIAKLNINGNSEIGLVSKNFSNPLYDYKRVSDFNLPSKNDLSNLERIKAICKSENEYRLILEDLKKLFIRDFYAIQGDRTENNLLFKKTENSLRLAPLYDYESSFGNINEGWYSNSLGTLDLMNKKTIYLLKNDDKFHELIHLIIKLNIL